MGLGTVIIRITNVIQVGYFTYAQVGRCMQTLIVLCITFHCAISFDDRKTSRLSETLGCRDSYHFQPSNKLEHTHTREVLAIGTRVPLKSRLLVQSVVCKLLQDRAATRSISPADRISD